MLAITYDTKGQEEVKTFTRQFEKRLKGVTGAQIFDGKIQTLLIGQGTGLILLEFKVLLPPFHFLFLFGSVGAFFLGAPIMTVFLLGLFSLFVFLRSKYFFYMLLKKGLRKAGYNKNLRLL